MSASMPSSDNVKAGAMLALIGLGVYLVYKGFGAASSIKSQVSDTVGSIGDAIKGAADTFGVQSAKVQRFMGGPATTPVDDQSLAETARLNRQAGGIVDAQLPEAMALDPSATPQVPESVLLGTDFLGSDTRTSTPAPPEPTTQIDFGKGGNDF